MLKSDKDDQMVFCFSKTSEPLDCSNVISMYEAKIAREKVKKKQHEKDVINRIVKVSERLRW